MTPRRSEHYRDIIDDEIAECVQFGLALWREMRDEHGLSEDHHDVEACVERIKKHMDLT